MTALWRFTLLIALGVVLDGIGSLTLAPRWGVLQTLGLGGAIGTVLADLPDAAVATLALGMGLYGGASGEVHHGPIAAVEEGDLIHFDLDAGQLAVVGVRGEPRPETEIADTLRHRLEVLVCEPVPTDRSPSASVMVPAGSDARRPVKPMRGKSVPLETL